MCNTCDVKPERKFADAPKCKIVEAVKENALTRRNRYRGYIVPVILECGHLTDANRTERKRGWMHCFDCYYGKYAPYADYFAQKEPE